MGYLRLEGLRIELPGFSVGPLDLCVEKGEFFVILGPTGAGKSLILEAIAGLVFVSSGRIVLDGEDITDLPPEKRGISIVYQDLALFPHMSVRDNISYGAKVRGIPKGDRERRLLELSRFLSIEHLLDRDPLTLSGGEAQRVAIARALMVEPSLLLLDEPLSSIDQKMREDLGNWLKRVNKKTGVTVIMVTHDIKEALVLSDRVAVLNNGQLEQVGPTQDVFRRPKTGFVASFLGVRNILKVKFEKGFAVTGSLKVQGSMLPEDGEGYISIRPEDIVISKSPAKTSARNVFEGTVKGIRDLGYVKEVEVDCGGVGLVSWVTGASLDEMGISLGDRVWLIFKATSVNLLGL